MGLKRELTSGRGGGTFRGLGMRESGGTGEWGREGKRKEGLKECGGNRVLVIRLGRRRDRNCVD